MLKRLLPLCLGIALTAQAQGTPQPWADDLLGLTGTTLVFDSPPVRKALAAGETPRDLDRLAAAAGFRPWAGGRVWLLQYSGGKLSSWSASAPFLSEMNRRGLVLNFAPNSAVAEKLEKALQATPASIPALRQTLHEQQTDALILVSGDDKTLRWQFYSADFQQTGSLEKQGAMYLPHVWAENLALNWQWPELKQAALIHIGGLNNFGLFKSAENLLATMCSGTRLLRLQNDEADFSCQNAAGAVPEKLGLAPVLLPVPLADHGLDNALLVGRQLSNRFAAYRWQTR